MKEETVTLTLTAWELKLIRRTVDDKYLLVRFNPAPDDGDLLQRLKACCDKLYAAYQKLP